MYFSFNNFCDSKLTGNLNTDIKKLIELKSQQYQTPEFINNDPIAIPKKFVLQQDIEITAFWMAILSWGNRKSIINSGLKLIERMDHHPYDFILHHTEKDREKFLDFKHRTFQAPDTLYFLEFFQWYYRNHSSLQDAFVPEEEYKASNVEEALIHFHNFFFSRPHLAQRTRKHVASPKKNSSCKRLNMFLRWMVRPSSGGVDFGLWKKISPAQLIIPLDVHVHRTALKLGIIQRSKADWKAALELNAQLKIWRPEDPCYYDYGLFGLGVESRSTLKGM